VFHLVGSYSSNEKSLMLVGCKKMTTNEDAFPKEAKLNDDDDDDDKHGQHALASINSLTDIFDFHGGGCEATRRLYIDPVLCAAGLGAK
jgi:hypothetical protein